jgi:chemosensory pili system protein ChpA (sensor histidine kinase/response regulator)
MNVADCLETMSEALIGMSPAPEDAVHILQSVLDWANRIDKEGIPLKDSDLSDTSSSNSEPLSTEPVVISTKEVASAPVKKSFSISKQQVTAKEVEAQTTVPMLRVPAPLIDDLLRLVGESIILTGQVQERINININQAKAVKEQNRVLQQLTSELEQLVDVQGVTTVLGQKPVWGNSDFDPLEFDQYNELHTVTRRLVEIANDARALDENIGDNFAALETLIIDQGHLHRDSQEAVLRTRMVPVKTVVPRLQRSVRQTCRLTDKNVDLNVSGADTLMDTNILSDMIDPLMHVLRNAVDHGIETPEARTVIGKSPVGKINLSFTREGNTIVVRCQDDGSGLDYESIRYVGEQRGLITAEQPVTEDELNRLILHPGFSTRKETTQVSGRGIGMDAVYNQLLKIKGSINIQSTTGKGCLVELRLPITLISTHALLIRVRQQIFAVSDRGIEQILHANSGELHRVGDIMTYQMGDDIYEIVYLDSLLGLSTDRRKNDRINERPA